ncbi:hypothetical protein K2173_021622 [Erythroxylum novogranatense]|uniref:BHLH domain-containing protein n=1 Tax=Erythroxylum novogranatense TaxID=1862640 RepID=A0AAV8TQV4_9ROSI|nr:hypothetical protein K2173_021622 [Erythroxylum novogranatense]
MDYFFQDGSQDDHDLLWPEIFPLQYQRCFMPYTSRPICEIRVDKADKSPCSGNINKRMIEFMRRRFPVRFEAEESESKRCVRHMICERKRREREKEGYSALHSVLPPGTKNDKNSIVSMAGRRIEELKRYKKIMERRNQVLEGELSAMGRGNVGFTKIKIRVPNPASGLDSMLEVLQCLNSMGSKTSDIQSKISCEELVAVIDIEAQIGTAEIQRAVQRTLQEVEGETSMSVPCTN